MNLKRQSKGSAGRQSRTKNNTDVRAIFYMEGEHHQSRADACLTNTLHKNVKTTHENANLMQITPGQDNNDEVGGNVQYHSTLTVKHAQTIQNMLTTNIHIHL